ncbi:MAG: hypothetical protein JO100_06445 [Pseudonocardia sp.]|nr:hypothetical protein [Pseudonocardia sp.]
MLDVASITGNHNCAEIGCGHGYCGIDDIRPCCQTQQPSGAMGAALIEYSHIAAFQ